jgi:hypothetical protein
VEGIGVNLDLFFLPMNYKVRAPTSLPRLCNRNRKAASSFEMFLNRLMTLCAPYKRLHGIRSAAAPFDPILRCFVTVCSKFIARFNRIQHAVAPFDP